jgi:hypothetical protein
MTTPSRTFVKSPAKLRLAVPEIHEKVDSNLIPRVRRLVSVGLAIGQIATSYGACHHLRIVPDMGPLISTATVAVIGKVAAFGIGREFAAFHGTCSATTLNGGKERLPGISKRNNSY